jgi:clan AA aspartic protease
MNSQVTSRQALLDVTFRLLGRPDLAIEFVIDTGFAGHLTLPAMAVQALQLPSRSEITATLADDSVISVNVYTARIVWNAVERTVDVLATGARPLLGTLLLDGHELTVHFTEGGLVSLASL